MKTRATSFEALKREEKEQKISVATEKFMGVVRHLHALTRFTPASMGFGIKLRGLERKWEKEVDLLLSDKEILGEGPFSEERNEAALNEAYKLIYEAYLFYAERAIFAINSNLNFTLGRMQQLPNFSKDLSQIYKLLERLEVEVGRYHNWLSNLNEGGIYHLALNTYFDSVAVKVAVTARKSLDDFTLKHRVDFRHCLSETFEIAKNIEMAFSLSKNSQRKAWERKEHVLKARKEINKLWRVANWM